MFSFGNFFFFYQDICRHYFAFYAKITHEYDLVSNGTAVSFRCSNKYLLVGFLIMCSGTTPPPMTGVQWTVVFVKKMAAFGQDLFICGGMQPFILGAFKTSLSHTP